MLTALCGNKSVQKILLFLFVNGKCYGTQLHYYLKTPLTPIQKALLRLEKGGIIMSYYEGKTRLYQFDPSFPLLGELELLLKKAYTLLPAHEKKNYYVSKEEDALVKMSLVKKKQALNELWEKMLIVRQLTFNAKSKSNEDIGWNGKGKGNVQITKEREGVLIFHEKGSWISKQGQEIGFSNVFRWTLDRSACVISLEHLRFGLDNPVFLFHLAPSGSRSFSSVDSHLCEGDAYFGQIYFDKNSFRLSWRVIGPKKNETIDYFYS